MKYLNSKFSMQPPEKLDGLGCPRCALGPKWGEHTEDCLKKPKPFDWSLRLPKIGR